MMSVCVCIPESVIWSDVETVTKLTYFIYLIGFSYLFLFYIIYITGWFLELRLVLWADLWIFILSHTGDIWNDARREAVDWRSQFGQKGLLNLWPCVTVHVLLVLCWIMLCPPLHFQVYYEPMLKLDIMTESELGQIFGTLDSLIPLHEGELVHRWRRCYWRQQKM